VTFQISNMQTTIKMKGAICIPALALIALAMLDTKKISSRGRLIYFKLSHFASGYSRRLQKGSNRYCPSMPFMASERRTRSCYFKRESDLDLRTSLKADNKSSRSTDFRLRSVPDYTFVTGSFCSTSLSTKTHPIRPN